MARLTLDSPSLRLRIPPRIASYSLCNAAPTYKRDARNTGREWHSHHPPLALALGRDRSRRPVSARSLARVVVGLVDSASASSRPARLPERAHPCALARPRSPRAQLRGWMVLQPPRRCHPPSPPRSRSPRVAAPLAVRHSPGWTAGLLPVRHRGGEERRRRGTTLEVRVVRGIGSDAHSVATPTTPHAAAPLRGARRRPPPPRPCAALLSR